MDTYDIVTSVAQALVRDLRRAGYRAYYRRQQGNPNNATMWTDAPPAVAYTSSPVSLPIPVHNVPDIDGDSPRDY